MRFVVIVPANADSEAGKLPDEKSLRDMMEAIEARRYRGVIARNGRAPVMP